LKSNDFIIADLLRAKSTILSPTGGTSSQGDEGDMEDEVYINMYRPYNQRIDLDDNEGDDGDADGGGDDVGEYITTINMRII
jgi:hypothetical protein